MKLEARTIRVICVIVVDVVVDVCGGSLGLVVLATGVVDESVDSFPVVTVVLVVIVPGCYALGCR
jgi:hypothetical protein